MIAAARETNRLQLPSDQPTLVMLGSDDPEVLDVLDRLLRQSARQLDLRSNALWTEVSNGRDFLGTVLHSIGTGRERVRFAFAAPHATVQELLRYALLAPDLEQLAQMEGATLNQGVSPHYQVRYQPIVALGDRSTIGFESLIWATSGQETLSAQDLIQRARTGDWLAELDAMCRTLAIEGVGPWLGEGLLFLNVMAPSGTFDEEAILGTLDQAANIGLAADQLVLEAVEQNRYASLLDASKQIELFRSRGARIAVDDVGEGYSSLRKVATFKPDIVKIAGTLAPELATPEGRAVVRAIVQLAHETGAWVVAENIETADQAQQASDLGIDWGQGHFFGAPGLP